MAAALLLLATIVACDVDEEEGAVDGTPTAPATATPTEEATQPATATPDGAEREDQAQEQAGQYAAALQLALQEEFGSEDVEQLVSEWNIDVTPDGEGLPPGSGTVEQGAQIYQTQCSVCHGENLEGALATGLVADAPEPWEPGDTPRIGNWWPYATTVWDYINRAMPFYEPGSLSSDEVYALTAFILAENGIIESDEEMNQDTLPQVEMPARDIFHACWPDVCYDEYGRQDGQ